MILTYNIKKVYDSLPFMNLDSVPKTRIWCGYIERALNGFALAPPLPIQLDSIQALWSVRTEEPFLFVLIKKP